MKVAAGTAAGKGRGASAGDGGAELGGVNENVRLRPAVVLARTAVDHFFPIKSCWGATFCALSKRPTGTSDRAETWARIGTGASVRVALNPAQPIGDDRTACEGVRISARRGVAIVGLLSIILGLPRYEADLQVETGCLAV